MNKTELIRKLTSRKFFAFLSGFIGSLLVAFNVSESDIAQVTAIVAAFGSVIVYIFAEASVDKVRYKESDNLPNEGDEL